MATVDKNIKKRKKRAAKKTAKYRLEEKKKSKQTEIPKWEDLLTANVKIKELIRGIDAGIKKLEAKYKDVIDNNEEVRKLYIGVLKTVEDLARELLQLQEAHTTQTPEGIKFFGGPVDLNDDRSFQLYTNLAIGYGNLFSRVNSVAYTSLAALLSEIAVVTGETGNLPNLSVLNDPDRAEELLKNAKPEGEDNGTDTTK